MNYVPRSPLQFVVVAPRQSTCGVLVRMYVIPDYRQRPPTGLVYSLHTRTDSEGWPVWRSNVPLDSGSRMAGRPDRGQGSVAAAGPAWLPYRPSTLWR